MLLFFLLYIHNIITCLVISVFCYNQYFVLFIETSINFLIYMSVIM